MTTQLLAQSKTRYESLFKNGAWILRFYRALNWRDIFTSKKSFYDSHPYSVCMYNFLSKELQPSQDHNIFKYFCKIQSEMSSSGAYSYKILENALPKTSENYSSVQIYFLLIIRFDFAQYLSSKTISIENEKQKTDVLGIIILSQKIAELKLQLLDNKHELEKFDSLTQENLMKRLYDFYTNQLSSGKKLYYSTLNSNVSEIIKTFLKPNYKLDKWKTFLTKHIGEFYNKYGSKLLKSIKRNEDEAIKINHLIDNDFYSKNLYVVWACYYWTKIFNNQGSTAEQKHDANFQIQLLKLCLKEQIKSESVDNTPFIEILLSMT